MYTLLSILAICITVIIVPFRRKWIGEQYQTNKIARDNYQLGYEEGRRRYAELQHLNYRRSMEYSTKIIDGEEVQIEELWLYVENVKRIQSAHGFAEILLEERVIFNNPKSDSNVTS